MPERNAPCPCGSGKKYKRCCLPKDMAAAAAAFAYTSTDRDRALARLMKFAARKEFDQDHELGATLFWGGPPAPDREDEFERLVDSEAGTTAYLTWFAFDLDLEPGRTPLDHFLERHGGGLSTGERAYLDRMRTSHVRLYEILAVRNDEGVELRDLLTDRDTFVRERLATRQLARWDLIAARVIEGPRGDLLFETIPCVFPPSCKEALVADLRRAEREWRQGPFAGDEAAFFRRFVLLLQRVWVEQVALPPRPTIVTVEGDPFVLTKAVFDVRDADRLAVILGGHAELATEEDGRFVWLAAGPGEQRRVLGHFTLSGKRLTVETMSEKRAEGARTLVKDAAGDLVTYRATRVESVEPTLAEQRQAAFAAGEKPAHAAGRDRAKRSSGLPPEEEAHMVREMLDRHYHEWLDIPLPALGNRTPRHAARLKTVRPRLIEVLKTFDNHAERDRLEGRPAYDPAWLWEELGVERR